FTDTASYLSHERSKGAGTDGASNSCTHPGAGPTVGRSCVSPHPAPQSAPRSVLHRTAPRPPDATPRNGGPNQSRQHERRSPPAARDRTATPPTTPPDPATTDSPSLWPPPTCAALGNWSSFT